MSSSKLKTNSIALLMIFALYSCKADTESDVSTVDNFAGVGSFTLNSCKPDQNSAVYGEDLAAINLRVDGYMRQRAKFQASDEVWNSISQDVADVLKVIPKNVAEAYFASDAKIYLSDIASPICTQMANSSSKIGGDAEKGVQEMFACWERGNEANGVALGAGKANGKNVSLREAIRHGLLRMMVYYYMSDVLSRENIPAVQDMISTAPSSSGSKMVAAFRADLQKLNPAANIPADSKDFRLSLYTEVLDSRYCSQETHQKFKSSFPSLYSES